MNKQFTTKPMTIEDYDGLHALWMTIHGFGIRSIDLSLIHISEPTRP